MANVVAIVGRPNVGKSTLFNRLTESRAAIVDEISGVTRDRHYGICEWNGRDFTVIDTGGYVKGSDDIFEAEIRKQVEIAVEEASMLMFVVDVTTGVTDLDKTVANLLRRSKKKVFLVANKVDNGERETWSAEFYSLGLGDLYNISAVNGSGTGDLLDDVIKALPDDENVLPDLLPKLAIVGRPNVGKSSLLNALVGEDRNIVTNIAGTTRDALHTEYNKFGYNFLLVDTAGVRKKSKVHEDLEFYSVMRSLKAIDDCNVMLLVLDAQDGLEAQDMNLLKLAEKNHKGLVIIVNKWDLVEKDNHTLTAYEDNIREKISPFKDVPILFVSALTKQRIFKIVETANHVFNNTNKKIKTRELNDFMLPIVESQPPPALNGHYIKIKYVTMIPTKFPAFAFFCNQPQLVKDSYKRFLENKLRAEYDFTGVPIELYFRQK